MQPDADIAIIGAGSGGLSVAAVAGQLGLSTVLIERGRMGGDCLNTGCVPSKALLSAAHAADQARNLLRFGITAQSPVIDWAGVQQHVHGVISALAPADSVERFERLGVRVLQAEARFVAADVLNIGGTRLRARRIVVAAGSRPAIPNLPGLLETGYYTHETIFNALTAPTHLLILGGGPIGLEMGQAHARLGCRVTIVAQGRVGEREDPELIDVIRAALLRTDRVHVLEHARVVAVKSGPTLVMEDGTVVSGSHLLIGAGRVPNVEALDLASGGIRATEQGVATDAGLRSLTNRHVFAVGDVADPKGIGPRRLTHSASYDAAVVIRRAIFHLPARLRSAMPRVLYTDPELAQVGVTEAEACAAARPVTVLRWPMTQNDRAATERATEGLVKLVVGRGGRLLGGGIVAPHAGDMIGVLTLALDERITLAKLATLIVPYPTRSEAIKRAAGSHFSARLFGKSTRRLVSALRFLP